MKTNHLGLTKSDYVGAKSTLCTGCGHDSITSNLINSLFQSSTDPYSVVKISGIGCSSKTPNYFLNQSHGFNSVHGRMAPLATGIHAVNSKLKIIGISGDGDTASIGLGSFMHLLRRDTPMVYIVENNGVYGLTKGQFSATADHGSTMKSGEANTKVPFDLCSLAIEAGCRFVARSFSGDNKQLTALFNLALRHNGVAFLDIVSPCVTFANHEGSTKSYDAVKANTRQLQELGFIQPQEEITAEYGEGEVHQVELFDGSRIWLRKMDSTDGFQMENPDDGLRKIRESRNRGEILTGLLHWRKDGAVANESPDAGLISLKEQQLKPKAESLKSILAGFR